jgi:hypothetical protein
VAWALAFLLLLPAVARAQGPSPSPHEHVGVGVVGTGVLGADPWPVVSARVSVPLGARVGIDADLGRAFGGGLSEGQVPTGAAALVHLRWLHSGRRPSGWSGYLLAGPRVLAAQNIDQAGRVTDHRAITVVDVGYGFDRLMTGGWRSGAEVGGGGGEGPLFFVSGFVVWGRH